MRDDRSTLFLDLDGPILDNRPKYIALHRQLLNDASGLALAEEEYWGLKRALVPETEILSRCGVPTIQWDDYLRRRQAYIEHQQFLKLDRVWPGVKDWLVEQGATHAIYLVTLRKRRKPLFQQLARLGLLQLFEAILSEEANDGSADVKVRLMTPYLEFAKDAVMIGDTEADVQAAKQTNVASIAVTCGIRDRSLLEAEMPDQICPRLIDVNLRQPVKQRCEASA